MVLPPAFNKKTEKKMLAQIDILLQGTYSQFKYQ